MPHYIGLMSGTSMDGVDAVACEIAAGKNAPLRIKLLAHAACGYPEKLKERLFKVAGPDGSAGEVCALNAELGELFAKAALKLMKHPALAGIKLAAIGSHGQTIRHMPQLGATLQISSSALIAARAKLPVWSDFRSADMARGGQGAPLAPVIHLPLFGSARENVSVVNLGGVANITHIPAGAKSVKKLIAYDTGPGNMLMDYAVGRMGAGGFDKNGRIAARGEVDEALLQRWLRFPYFRRKAPKSTGREMFGGDVFFATAGAPLRWDSNAVATITELTARSIAGEIIKLGRLGRPTDMLVLCGGGAKNRYLAGRISALLKGIKVRTSDDLGAPAQWIEGALMALLAHYAAVGEPLDMSSITGAHEGPALLGALAPRPESAKD
ncbi:MAG: anhydro-N-acetylmuramic acid kinase [Nitrospinae bacterium]|nr:anhydro-N-acetylmuramic acid kinase [Nitrospinota bacterium]